MNRAHFDMLSLKAIFKKAGEEHWAVGHFNASELDQVRAIVAACASVRAPAMIGTSEGERDHLGLPEAIALRDAFRAEFSIPIFLNADHTHTVAKAKEAVDAGYDSVHIDLSKLPLEENITGTREVVAYATRKDPNISIEGEVGYLVTDSSSVHSEKIDVPMKSLATPEVAVRFAKETGVDRLAPAVGSFHGISTGGEKSIHIDLIRSIRVAVPSAVALVLHGGSSLSEENFRAAIEAGMANIHVSTELRMAYVAGMREEFSKEIEEVAMYKLDTLAIEKMKEAVVKKLELFGSVGRL